MPMYEIFCFAFTWSRCCLYYKTAENNKICQEYALKNAVVSVKKRFNYQCIE